MPNNLFKVSKRSSGAVFTIFVIASPGTPANTNTKFSLSFGRLVKSIFNFVAKPGSVFQGPFSLRMYAVIKRIYSLYGLFISGFIGRFGLYSGGEFISIHYVYIFFLKYPPILCVNIWTT
jgi:hypothetical protein